MVTAAVAADVVVAAAALVVPPDARALFVTEVDQAPGGVFTGHWLCEIDWRERWDEDVVVALTPNPRGGLDLEVTLVHDGRLLPFGAWQEVDGHWPETVRSTVASAMSLHTDLQTMAGPGVECTGRVVLEG